MKWCLRASCTGARFPAHGLSLRQGRAEGWQELCEQLFVTGPFTDRYSFIRCVYMQTAQVRLQQSKAGGSVMKHHPISCSWDPQWLCSFNRITEVASLSPKTPHGILQPFPLPPDMHTPQSSTYLFWLLLEKTLNNI